MIRRTAAAVLVAGIALGAPASAYELPIEKVIVRYEVDPSRGYVWVGTGIPNQPLVGGYVDASQKEACVGFSYQVPQCVGRTVERIEELIQTG